MPMAKVETRAARTKSPAPRASASAAGSTNHVGHLNSAGRRFAIVVSRFNEFIGDRLVDGALDAIRRTGGSVDDVEIFRCPGAMELPGLLQRVVDLGRFDGVICLGVVIRGATPHFDLVVGQAIAGISRLAATGQVAIACGVLACETIEQALERAGTKAGNRGADAAMVAIEMADLYATFPPGSGAASGK
jgi:6,7-dimethyl-8-ribityllumazine synthase